MNAPVGSALAFPFAEQDFGVLTEVAPGILWARLPLPYQPGHVNTYLLEDWDGWWAVDCGLLDEATIATWERILVNLPRPGRISRVVVTHWHSDHMGAAGWLCGRCGVGLVTTESEYLKSLAMEFLPREVAGEIERSFFLVHGLDRDATEEWVRSGHRYLYMAAPLPRTFDRLVAGQQLRIGRRLYEVRTGMGHSPEELMLRAADRDVYLCADQMGPRIAPNIAVQPSQPSGRPLELYFATLDAMAQDQPGDALMLPGHEQPFRGFAQRATELRAYYEQRCATVEAACADRPKTGAEILGRLFKRPPGPVWVGFLLSEVITYAHHLVAQGRLRRRTEDQKIYFELAESASLAPRPA
jgi:glyoxylase-like metal-dependent hydrolase (beta-lactamase superfamily II)